MPHRSHQSHRPRQSQSGPNNNDTPAFTKEARMTRQNNRLLRLTFPNGDGPSSLVANRLDAVEGLSRDFHFTVECLTDDPHIALKDVQGKMVTVEMVREDNSV